MKRKLTYVLAFAGAAAIALAAYAQQVPGVAQQVLGAGDAAPIATTKIGLAQAVATAEAHVGGKATEAEFERNKAGQWVFDVEVAKGQAVTNVTVDAGSGNVLAAVADKPDNDDDKDDDKDDD